MENTEQLIQDIISQLNFKESETINFDALTEQIHAIIGTRPSIVPKWQKIESANEDLLLDGSNKIVEKITKIKIAYLDHQNLPITLEYYV